MNTGKPQLEPKRFKCVTIPLENQERFDDALSDVLCWLDGFLAGGGTYSPGSRGTLREVREMVSNAYETIPPLKPEPPAF